MKNLSGFNFFLNNTRAPFSTLFTKCITWPLTTPPSHT